jgi:hypothetical protein
MHPAAYARLLSNVSTKYTISAFGNLTAVGVGRRVGTAPQHSAAPDRRPEAPRLKPHRLFYRAGASTLGS